MAELVPVVRVQPDGAAGKVVAAIPLGSLAVIVKEPVPPCMK